MTFQNRKQAGQLLANKLQSYATSKPLVLALPRGGVPVAAEIAKVLKVPLEILATRKIGAPFSVEYAVGAICENEEPIFSEMILPRMGLEPDDLNQTVADEKKEIRRQIKIFRNGKELSSVLNKTVIVVDDGLATGATAMAAVRFLKRKGVGRVVVAVPVAAKSSAKLLKEKVDDIVTLAEASGPFAVGQWYADFSQVSDEEVLQLLEESYETTSQLNKPFSEVETNK